MQENVFLQITIVELEGLIERATERSVQKIIGKEREKPDETLLTTEQVIAEFKISRVTLSNYKNSKKLLPYSKAGKQHAYRRCDCQKAFFHKTSINNI
jgi:predicted DNA-binding helix-hairpin-helix protein